MNNKTKQMLLASMAVSGLVAATAVVDLISGIPYSHATVFDVLFVVSAAIIIYMAYEAYKETT